MLLGAVLRLHDIENVEAFCTEAMRRANLTLSVHEEEDLLTYLIETCWELSLRYDPARDPNQRGFGNSAFVTLKQRAIGWDQRIRRRRLKWQFSDRTYERPAVHVDSLDRLGAAIPEREAHSTDDGLADLVRVLGEGGSAKPGHHNGPGKKAPGIAA